jgi:hypothetical protein
MRWLRVRRLRSCGTDPERSRAVQRRNPAGKRSPLPGNAGICKTVPALRKACYDTPSDAERDSCSIQSSQCSGRRKPTKPVRRPSPTWARVHQRQPPALRAPGHARPRPRGRAVMPLSLWKAGALAKGPVASPAEHISVRGPGLRHLPRQEPDRRELVEKRGEASTTGWSGCARPRPAIIKALPELLGRLVSEMTNGRSEDEIAIVGVRWKS